MLSVTLFTVLLLLNVSVDVSYSKSQLIQLNEDNWERMLTGEWMVEFYAPWCPACKALQQHWEEFSMWSKQLGLSVGQVDVTKSPGLSGRFMVTALPTIFHVIDGEFRQYKGTRDKNSFKSFIEDHTWEKIEAIPSWKSPSSIQMSLLSQFFKLSQVLRVIHNLFTEDYGLPYWGSYLIFAVVTIILGAILGLLAVCFIDFFYPPKSAEYRSVPTGDKSSDREDSEDDLAEEELIDDQNLETNSARKQKTIKAD